MNEVIFKAKLERVVYDGETWKIYGVKPNSEYRDLKMNKFKNVSIVGDLPKLEKDVEYTIKATEKKDGKYGYQYVVLNIFRDKPTTLEQARKFLTEVITERQANILLEVYPDIIDRIVNDEEIDLTLTKGIKEHTFAKIKKKVLDDICLVELIDDYKGYGMTLNMIRKLFNTFGSVEKVRENMEKNPYKCLCKINGVGFLKADEMILGIKPHLKDSQQRCESCMMYQLEHNEQEGSTYMARKELYEKVKMLTPESIKHFDDVLIFCAEDIFSSQNCIAKKRTYFNERYIAEKVVKINKDSKVLNIDIEKYCYGEFPLTEEQKGALKNLCEYNVSMLIGYAGAGKTQTTKAIIDMLEDNRLTFTLLSPTGRASEVLSEYTERDASTIHRGLGYSGTGWFFNEKNPLDSDVIIVDEFPMVDVSLARHLLEAIELGTRVLFIGDVEQLPSVGCGNLGFDMINSALIPITFLTKIFRYGEGGLMQVATKTRNGERYLDSHAQGIHNFGEKKDYSAILVEKNQTIEYMKFVFSNLLKNGIPIDEIIVLSAMNKGEFGTVNLNKHIQLIANPPSENKREITFRDITFREGDRVMQIRNNYSALLEPPEDMSEFDLDFDEQMLETQIFNGNIGTIKYIKGDITYVDFGDKTIQYKKEDLDELLLGYCITVHKSQGSGFKHVILVNPEAHMFFLNKNLLYVGLTRAKERVYHITTPKVIAYALKQKIILKRNTLLKDLLIYFSKEVDNDESK